LTTITDPWGFCVEPVKAQACEQRRSTSRPPAATSCAGGPMIFSLPPCGPELLHTIAAPAFRTASAAGDEVTDLLSKREALVRIWPAPISSRSPAWSEALSTPVDGQCQAPMTKSPAGQDGKAATQSVRTGQGHTLVCNAGRRTAKLQART